MIVLTAVIQILACYFSCVNEETLQGKSTYQIIAKHCYVKTLFYLLPRSFFFYFVFLFRGAPVN